MYCFGGHKVPSAQSVSDQGEMVSALNWERKGDCKDMGGDGTYQKKKETLTQQLLETREGEDRLAHGEGCSEQGSCLEVKRVLQQEAKGEEDPVQDGGLLGRKERLDAGSWTLEFESESVHEEIYWGCFYFFPWLRMCRRDKREQT